jgi:uncharacterized protein (TIRG00374 family)
LKRFFLLVLKIIISLGLVGFFLQRIEWGEIELALSSASLSFWILAVLLFLASNLLGAFQWGELLRIQDIRLPVRKVVGLYFVGVFFNNFLVSNIGGDAVRIYDLKRLTGQGLAGFAATFLDRFIGLFTLICFSIVAYALSPGLWGMALWMPILLLAILLLAVLIFGFSRRMSNIVVRFARRMLPLRLVEFLENVREGFLLYRHAYSMILRVALLASCVQLSRIAVYYSVGHALGQSVPFGYYVVFIPLIAIVAAIPVSFGGIGVRENMGVLLFGRVGMGDASALAVMFLGYLAGIVASLAGGILFVVRRSSVSEDNSVPSQEVG